MADNTVSVRISGNKGHALIEPKDGATAIEVVREMAGLLGIPVPEGNALLVDGVPAKADTPVKGAKKVDSVPKPNLG